MKNKLTSGCKIGTIFLVLIMSIAGIGISYAGFTDTIYVHGMVNTASVELQVVDYSATWVYKDLTTHEKVMFSEEQYDDNLMYIAKAIAYEGDENPYDVEFLFDNIFPCTDFIADFVVQYTGTIPVNVVEMSFETEDAWLEPLLYYKINHCSFVDNIWFIGEEMIINDNTGLSQIHPGDYIHVEVYIHLPQDNSLQGLTAEFSGRLIVMQWNDNCDSPPQGNKILDIPTEIVTVYNTVGMESYIITLLSNVPAGYDVVNEYYLGWCVDQDNTLCTYYDATLWSSYDNNIPYPSDSWDKVNYIINNKGTANKEQIQRAIWHYIDHGPYTGTDTVVLGLIADADANGEGFVPSEGEWLAVLCYPVNENIQKTIIEVDP